ncbi:MAG: SAM-dependent methyltransferase, partial [Pseudomonadota bacterium]
MNIETPGRFQRGRRASWRNRLLGSERFQSLAARVPILRSRVRAEGEAMMDLVAGFAHAQVLMALVELGVLEELQLGPLRSDQLSGVTRVPPE